MSAATPLPPPAQTFIRPDGTIDVNRLLEHLHLDKSDLAGVLGMSREAISKTSQLSSRRSQRQLRDLVEILSRVSPWAGSVARAFLWYTSQPLPAFGGKTAADLVREGRAEAVHGHLSRISIGGYA
jgi:hypothetical protein